MRSRECLAVSLLLLLCSWVCSSRRNWTAHVGRRLCLKSHAGRSACITKANGCLDEERTIISWNVKTSNYQDMYVWSCIADPSKFRPNQWHRLRLLRGNPQGRHAKNKRRCDWSEVTRDSVLDIGTCVWIHANPTISTARPSALASIWTICWTNNSTDWK